MRERIPISILLMKRPREVKKLEQLLTSLASTEQGADPCSSCVEEADNVCNAPF